jgi:Arc/MetJ-type ribon-helix-helix transcriptional regulator
MKKTSVYLSDEQADALRSAAAASGKSQSELIREGIRRVTARRPKRVFHSMGIADSGDPTLAERSEEILETEWTRDLLEESGLEHE